MSDKAPAPLAPRRTTLAALLIAVVFASACSDAVVPEETRLRRVTSISYLTGPEYWAAMSDTELWEYIIRNDTTLMVGLKAPAATQAMVRGQVTVSRDQWLTGIREIANLAGVAVIMADSTHLPILRVRAHNAEGVGRLRRLPFVAFAEPAIMPIHYASDCGDGNSPYGAARMTVPHGSGADTISLVFESMNIPNAWKLSTGSGIAVGIVGTGIDVSSASELTPNMGKSPNIHAYATTKYTPFPENNPYLVVEEGLVQPSCNHETRVGSVAVAGKNAIGTLGAAYNSGLISVRQGHGTHNEDAGYSAMSIHFAATRGAYVISMAFAWYPGTPSAVDMEINDHYYNGNVMFVGASGTCPIGTQCPQINSAMYPASKGEVLAVTGAHHNGDRPDVYNYGSKYEGVVAYTNLAADAMGQRMIVNLGGSSGASAAVTGIAALVRARNPAFSNRAVIDRIVRTSGSACGAPLAWRDNMVNASAAVGGACVQFLGMGPAFATVRKTVPDTAYTAGSEVIREWAASVVTRFADGYRPGGSGQYAVDWIVEPGIVLEGATSQTPAVNAAGDSIIRLRQSFRVLPAWNGNPYRTSIVGHIRDLSFGTTDVREREVLVCGYTTTCWGTSNPYPPPWTPPFTVNIVGTSTIGPGVHCQWGATPSYGTHPIIYEWRVDGVLVGDSSESLWYTNSGNPFTISVVATDADGRTASNEFYVDIVSGYWCE